jgi:hypothetical protein
MYKYIIYCFIIVNRISNKYFLLLYNVSNVLHNYNGTYGYSNIPENNATKNLDIINENYYKNLILNKEKRYITNIKIEKMFDEWNLDK